VNVAPPVRTSVPPAALGDLARTIADLAPSIAAPDEPRRCWMRLAATESFDAWLIWWPTGGAVDFHDHGGSAGAIAVVAGELTEVELAPGAGGAADVERRLLPAGSVHRLAADVVHDIVNAGSVPALSVHVYSPPLVSMTFYDPVDVRPLASRVIAEAGTDEGTPAFTWTTH
jgi:predicted metal-dependent enzyme (double-stranded beta helix superfamily)